MSAVATQPRRIPVHVMRDRAVSAAVLGSVGCATIEELADAVAAQFQLPRLQLDPIDIAFGLGTLVPRPLAEKHRIVPVFGSDQELTLAVCDPTDIQFFDWLARELKRSIALVIATATEIKRAQVRLYEGAKPVVAGDAPLDVSTEALAEAVKIVQNIITSAASRRASDIHIEATEASTVVRFRVDGVLHTMETWPSKLHAAIVSRIKVLADLDIAIKHVPQDGRIKLRVGAGEIDLRVSVLPTYWGEKVVCRILDNKRAVQTLDEIGFDPEQREQFEKVIHAPYGLVLVTGPTGSGKSTTLYSALNAVKTPSINVVTVEDPVEYQLAGINQVAVNAKRGITFASALRSILRQDPNVILIGEVRDAETGVIAAEAALTGHLVLTSLHTNDAISALTRLTELGIPPHLVAPSLLGIVAQRLARKICEKCTERYAPPAEELALLGVPEVPEGTLVCRGKGCKHCHGTGYAGRIAIRELLTVDDRMRAAIARGAAIDEVRGLARAARFKSMRFYALRAWLAGETTAREVVRLTWG